jgi:hypothetical protein
LGSTRDVVVGRDGGGGARKEDPGRRDDDEGIGDGDNNDASPLNKRRYGSVIDYLEAKYVWGMMINDCDETRAARGCGKKKKRGRRVGPTITTTARGGGGVGGGGGGPRTKNWMVRGL